METDEKQFEIEVGNLHRRRELMADEKRYIIYYTFGDDEKTSVQNEVKTDV